VAQRATQRPHLFFDCLHHSLGLRYRTPERKLDDFGSIAQDAAQAAVEPESRENAVFEEG
jgi:hypothetical protein